MNSNALSVLAGIVVLLALAFGGFHGLVVVIALIVCWWLVRSICIAAATNNEKRSEKRKAHQREAESAGHLRQRHAQLLSSHATARNVIAAPCAQHELQTEGGPHDEARRTNTGTEATANRRAIGHRLFHRRAIPTGSAHDRHRDGGQPHHAEDYTVINGRDPKAAGNGQPRSAPTNQKSPTRDCPLDPLALHRLDPLKRRPGFARQLNRATHRLSTISGSCTRMAEVCPERRCCFGNVVPHGY
jgi:hypothetical protein